MKIEKILNLDDGEHHFHFEVPPGEMGMDVKDFENHLIFEKPVQSQVTLTKTGHTYYVKFTVSAEVRLPCDRCLTDVYKLIKGPFEIVYTDAKSRDNFNENTEIRLIDARHSNEIVLDKDAKDTLLLAMPSKILCKEDCKGLCSECGSTLNDAVCEHAVAMSEKV